MVACRDRRIGGIWQRASGCAGERGDSVRIWVHRWLVLGGVRVRVGVAGWWFWKRGEGGLENVSVVTTPYAVVLFGGLLTLLVNPAAGVVGVPIEGGGSRGDEGKAFVCRPPGHLVG